MAASGACLGLLEEMSASTGITLESVDIFAADIGPGSFTGVRVGVTIAKTFGYLYGKPVAGAPSFDLIAADTTVVMPSKKGEFFVRRVGCDPVRSVTLPEEYYQGFGPGVEDPRWPDAAGFAPLLEDIKPVAAMSFEPAYLIEPSISIPNKPFPKQRQVGG